MSDLIITLPVSIPEAHRLVKTVIPKRLKELDGAIALGLRLGMPCPALERERARLLRLQPGLLSSLAFLKRVSHLPRCKDVYDKVCYASAEEAQEAIMALKYLDCSVVNRPLNVFTCWAGFHWHMGHQGLSADKAA